MFTKETFSVEEWAQIISTPAAVGSFVITADPSGPLGTIKEYLAIMDSMAKFASENANANSLMGVVQEYLTTHKQTEEEKTQLQTWVKEQREEMKQSKKQSKEELQTLIRSKINGSFELLRAKGAGEDEITSFKHMLYHAAEAAANATKEGGFLGIGGTLVSDKESSVLAQIKAELGV